MKKGHIEPLGQAKSLTNVYLVLYDSVYYSTDRPRRDISEMKLGLAFVIISIRGSICRACSVEKYIKPFPVVHRENGFHEMCQWVVTTELSSRKDSSRNHSRKIARHIANVYSTTKWRRWWRVHSQVPTEVGECCEGRMKCISMRNQSNSSSRQRKGKLQNSRARVSSD